MWPKSHIRGVKVGDYSPNLKWVSFCSFTYPIPTSEHPGYCPVLNRIYSAVTVCKQQNQSEFREERVFFHCFSL